MRTRARARRTEARTESLWLAPSPTPIQVRLDRWAPYPHFLDSLAQYGALPEIVTVSWGPFNDFVRYGFDEPEEWDFVDDVARRLRRGVDLPPLVREGGHPTDGIHRAFAARSARLSVAPTIELVRPAVRDFV